MVNYIKLLFSLIALILISCADNSETENRPVAQSVPTNSVLTKEEPARIPINPSEVVAEQEMTMEEEDNSERITTTNTNTKEVEKPKPEVKRPKSTPTERQIKPKSQPEPAKEPKSTMAVQDKVDNPEANTSVPVPKREKELKPVTEKKVEPRVEETKDKNKAPSHDIWNQLLNQYVSASGKVNYNGFKKEQAKLDEYIQLLADNPPADNWSRNDKLAFWINAYNVHTVNLIVENLPVKSIMDLKGGKPFDAKIAKIGDKTYSLNNIENDIIRPRFNEPRIHFAVNCAAQSCPPLYNQAFTANQLNNQLAQLTKKFVNNSKFNQLAANEITVSKIFDWYSQDFDSLVQFLNKYADTKIENNAAINYKEYDWALNN